MSKWGDERRAELDAACAELKQRRAAHKLENEHGGEQLARLLIDTAYPDIKNEGMQKCGWCNTTFAVGTFHTCQKPVESENDKFISGELMGNAAVTIDALRESCEGVGDTCCACGETKNGPLCKGCGVMWKPAIEGVIVELTEYTSIVRGEDVYDAFVIRTLDNSNLAKGIYRLVRIEEEG